MITFTLSEWLCQFFGHSVLMIRMSWLLQIVCHLTWMAVRSTVVSTRWSEFLTLLDQAEISSKDQQQVCSWKIYHTFLMISVTLLWPPKPNWKPSWKKEAFCSSFPCFCFLKRIFCKPPQSLPTPGLPYPTQTPYQPPYLNHFYMLVITSPPQDSFVHLISDFVDHAHLCCAT